MGRKPLTKKRPPRRHKARTGGKAGRSPLSSLAGALFSDTQQRVLALLFGQPQRSFFTTELINLTRSGSGAVQRELHCLEQSGLVTTTRVGNQKHFQANPDAPIFQEIRGIVLKTVGLAEPLRAALADVRPQIRLAIVYGSIAKGTDTASSDVDLLVVSDELTLEQIYKAITPAEQELARNIHPTLYTTDEFHRRREAGDSFLIKVLAGEHLVLAGDDDGNTAARQPRTNSPTQGGAGQAI